MKMTTLRPVLVILALALVIGIAFQGSRGLYESTEGRYALCAREMLDTGKWLEPTLFGEPHWTKPPLTYWAIAAGVRVLGRNAWGARLPNALFFALTALAVAGIGARMWDKRTGFLAGVIYATSLFPAGVAFSLNTDTLLAMWETLAIFSFWSADRAPDRSRSRRWMLGMWLALGLGFATKGPPALIALVPVLVYRRRDPARKRKAPVFDWAGLVLFCLVGLSWYVYECLRNPTLLAYFLGDEIVGRVAGNEFGRNPEWYRPFTLYLPFLLAGAGLWSWYLWRALAEARLHCAAGWRALVERHGPGFFLATWLLLPFLLFSLSTSRMITYVLPLFPAVALIAARRAGKEWRSDAFPRKFLAVAVVMFLLIVTGKAVAAYRPPPRDDMGALYRLCRFDDKVSRNLFVLFQEHRQLGLNFYAHSRVVRAGLEPRGRMVGLERVFGEMRAPFGFDWQVVFICRRSTNRDLLMATLKREGFVPSETWGDANWFLARVELRAPPQKEGENAPAH
ncbi:MAG: glycosyltransferase family 39 protein [Kiritimatiellaeota bacterium]|nr:glycosyltransferase family 39 protein [Kiritimatiellota bacterium]